MIILREPRGGFQSLWGQGCFSHKLWQSHREEDVGRNSRCPFLWNQNFAQHTFCSWWKDLSTFMDSETYWQTAKLCKWRKTDWSLSSDSGALSYYWFSHVQSTYETLQGTKLEERANQVNKITILSTAHVRVNKIYPFKAVDWCKRINQTRKVGGGELGNIFFLLKRQHV